MPNRKHGKAGGQSATAPGGALTGRPGAQSDFSISFPSGFQAHLVRDWFEAVRNLALLDVLVGSLSWDVIDDIDETRVKVAVKGADSRCAYEKICVEFTNPAGKADSRCEDAGFNGQFDINFIARKGTKATVVCGDTELGSYNIPG